jgi:TonB family protein
MKNYFLIFAFTISIKLSGQSDTTIYYSADRVPASNIKQASFYEKLVKVSNDLYMLSEYSQINNKWQSPIMIKIKRLSDSSYLMTSKDERIRIYHKIDSGFSIKDFIQNRLIQTGNSKLIFPLVRSGLWKSFDQSSGKIQNESIYRDNLIITNKYWIDDSIFIKDTFRKVEIPPKYKGGSDALMSFIENNLIYPEKAKQKRIQGRVIVSGIITTEGKLVGGKILNTPDPTLADEALRVVNLLPQKWTPGKIGKENANTFIAIPITFRLQ